MCETLVLMSFGLHPRAEGIQAKNPTHKVLGLSVLAASEDVCVGNSGPKVILKLNSVSA